MAESEPCLEALFQTGDRDAVLRALMERHGEGVYRFALRMVRSPDAAEEIRQRVFIDAYRDLEHYQGKSSLQAWLYGIARNRCIDECRRNRRWTARFKNEPREDADAEYPSPEVELERHRLSVLVRNCLGKLAPAAREAVTLRYLEHLSYKEIAEIIDELPTTLQRRVARALPLLRRCVDAGSGGGPSNARYVTSSVAQNRATSCDHFWRDGVLLVESGQSDPHRETCPECQAAHVGYRELVEALALVDREAHGKGGWELRAWRQIAVVARERSRSRWAVPSLGAACAALALWFAIGRDAHENETRTRPRYEVSSATTKRSVTPHVGDTLRVYADHRDEVRVYRNKTLILRCLPGVPTIGCIPDAHGVVAQTPLPIIGTYDVIVARAPMATWVGTLDGDRAAILRSGGTSERFEFSAR